jgi:hypothetical protein
MSKQDIDFKIGADLKQFRSAMGNIDHSLKRLSGGFGALGGVIGASFAVDAIRQFVTESVELANQAEGVKVAFDRLNDPQLLSKLQTATAGTVDDLKLMQLAVNAKNFQIPMDVLANGLEFAQRRAVETGQSVDYLVDSFVTGLGRESVMVLDNLGIKATDLRKRMAEGGSMADAVGQIMAESFAESGERIMTTSMLIDQQRAEITNLKLAVGEQLQPVYSAFLNEVKGGLDSINTLISDQITGTERMAYIASFFQGAQGKVLRTYLDAQKLARTAIAQNEEAQKKLGKETNNTNNSTNNLGDAFEKTRNEAFFYTEAIHRLKEAHSMLYKAQGASINQFATASTSFKEFKKTWEDNVIQQGLKKGVDLTYILADAGFDAFTAFEELGNSIGNLLTSSFEAAMISGEDFFKVFIQGLKNMLIQLLAAVAAALVLAALLVVITGGGIGALSMKSIGTAFKHFTGPMMGVPSFGLGGGLGGAMQGGGVQVFGRLSGSDILISSERAGRDRTRLSGITG